MIISNAIIFCLSVNSIIYQLTLIYQLIQLFTN